MATSMLRAWQAAPDDLAWPRAATVALPFAWARQAKAKKHVIELMTHMLKVYREMGGEVVSVNRVHEVVNEAAKAGVVWPPPLFALLDDVKSRTGKL